jgi:DNA polymerase-1
MGIPPSMVADILAMMGDTSDNIKGVPGIGPKTAAKLIMEYGSIDGVYEHICWIWIIINNDLKV